MFEAIVGDQANSQAAPQSFEEKRELYADWVVQKATESRETVGVNVQEQITTRFSDAIPLRRLQTMHFVVVGAGGIGSPVVKNLVAMGARNITVIDDDDVEIQNIGTQFHKVTNLGMSKVEALQQDMMDRYFVRITTIKDRVTNLFHLYELLGEGVKIDVLVGCVDNMEFRNDLGSDLLRKIEWDENGDYCPTIDNTPALYIDCRMSLGLWHVFALPVLYLVSMYTDYPAVVREYIDEALFEQEEAVQEPCTARALGYTGENVAAYVSSLVDFWVRHQPLNDENNKAAMSLFLDTTVPGKDLCQMKWKAGFDARNFVSTMADPFKEKLKQEKAHLMRTVASLEEERKEDIKHLNEVKFQLLEYAKQFPKYKVLSRETIDLMVKGCQENSVFLRAEINGVRQLVLVSPGTTVYTINDNGKHNALTVIPSPGGVLHLVVGGEALGYEVMVRRPEDSIMSDGVRRLVYWLAEGFHILDVKHAIPEAEDESENEQTSELEPDAPVNVWNGMLVPVRTRVLLHGGVRAEVYYYEDEGWVFLSDEGNPIHATSQEDFGRRITSIIDDPSDFQKWEG